MAQPHKIKKFNFRATSDNRIEFLLTPKNEDSQRRDSTTNLEITATTLNNN